MGVEKVALRRPLRFDGRMKKWVGVSWVQLAKTYHKESFIILLSAFSEGMNGIS